MTVWPVALTLTVSQKGEGTMTMSKAAMMRKAAGALV